MSRRPTSRRPRRPRNTRGPKRPMFKLSFNYSGGGGFDPACREPCICVEEEPRALSMADIETKRQAGNALSIDDMLAFAQFNDDPLNAALGGSAFSDDYLSADIPDLGEPEIVGGPEKTNENQIEKDPQVEHHLKAKLSPPSGPDGQPFEVKSSQKVDNLAISLAMTIEIDSVEKREFAYTLMPNGAIHVRVGENSEARCVRGGVLCLHTHPAEIGVRNQSHRLGFGEADWGPVQAGTPLYLLNLNRQVFVLEYDLTTGYTPRFVDDAPYEGN